MIILVLSICYFLFEITILILYIYQWELLIVLLKSLNNTLDKSIVIIHIQIEINTYMIQLQKYQLILIKAVINLDYILLSSVRKRRQYKKIIPSYEILIYNIKTI